jgi:hypothetical protein
MGDEIYAYKVLIKKPEGKRPLRRPRHRCEGGIKVDLNEIGWYVVTWRTMAQNRDQWRAHGNIVIKFYLTGTHLIGQLLLLLLLLLVIVATVWNGPPDNWASIPGVDKRFFSSPQRPDRLWGPPNG